MKTLAGNRLLWIVLGIGLVAMLAFSAISSQQSAGVVVATPTAQASASASSQPAASGQEAAKPFLTAYQDPQAQPAPNGLLTMVGLLFKLAIVLGLIYLTVLGLRFFSNRGRVALPGSGAINVLDKTALGQNRELYLIDVADKVLLLGATATSINVLGEITDSDAIEDLRMRPQPSLPSAEPFLAYLKSVGEKVKPIAAEVAATATSTPRDLLKPADLVKRIEEHKRRLQASTASLQSEPVLEGDL